jgi:UDP-sulfoquinovose synthase
MEEHYYQPDRQHLVDLGYQPTRDIKGVMKEMMLDLLDNKDRIEAHADVLVPDIRWDGERKRSRIIG